MPDDIARAHYFRLLWVDLFGWERPIPPDTMLRGFFGAEHCLNDLNAQRDFTRQHYRDATPEPIGPIVQRVLAQIRADHGRQP